METLEEKPIGRIVAEDFRTAKIFDSLGMDFCCHGKRSLKDECERKNLDIHYVVSQVKETMVSQDDKETDFNSLPLDALIDYIIENHHKYVEANLPILSKFLEKLVAVHGSRHPELLEISKLFSVSVGELTTHMKKEELILFPFVKKLSSLDNVGGNTPNRVFGKIENPINMLIADHEDEGERFEKIKELANGFAPPADACNTFVTTYAILNEFKSDLHKHIHLENNILFPKAILLYEKLMTQKAEVD